MEHTPPRSGTTAAVVAKIAEAAVSAVPIFGGPAAVLLAAGITSVVEKRRDAWFASVIAMIEELRDRIDGLEPERLVENDVFVDALMAAARVVERTSQHEKLDALRNAVVNSALPGRPDTDVQATFLGLVGELTPTHLRLLRLFDDPDAWFAARPDLPRPPPAAIASSRRPLVEAALPDLSSDVADRFFSDLVSDGLINAGGGLSAMMSARGMWDRATTGFAREFLAFIMAPRVE